MFDDVVTVFVPVAQTTVLSLLAVPVCRAHGYDDVLPDAAEQTVQYTLLRPSDVPHGDAADGFAGVTKHHGLVIRASVAATQELLLKQAASTCNRFPWHPWCQRFTRRGCGVSRATLQETAARHKLRQQEQQSKAPRSRHTNVLQQQSQLPTPVQLVPVALHADHLFLQDLAAAIIQHNNSVLQHQQQQQQTLSQQQPLPAVPQHRQQARKQRSVPAVVLTPVLQQTVVPTAAAVLIQCSWRAHQRRLVSRVAERALLNRVARVIQRAWRAFLLRQRLKMLSVVAAAHRAAQQLRYSNLLCVSVGSRRLIDKAADRARSTAAVAAAAAAGGSAGGLFPEHRLRFVIDNEGSVLLVDTSSTAAAASNTTTTTSSSSSTEHNTATLQQHVAHTADNEDPESSSAAAVAAVRRVGFPTWLGITVPIISAAAAAKILEDQLWFEPFGRADVAKLLEIGSEVQDIIPPETVTDSAACHPADVAQMITFKSKQQAAAAAVLLAALTYDVGSQSACRLTSVLDTPLGAAYRTSAGGGYCSSTGGTAAAAAAGSWAGSSSSSSGGMRNLVATSCSEQHDNADLVATDGANQGNSTSGEAAAAAAMVQTSLNGSSIHSSSGGQKQAAHFLTNVPLVSIQPTETLTECVAADASLTSGPATSTSAAAGGLQFHTHLYSRLPYMQRIEAAAQAEASTTASTAAQDATNSSNADQEDLQAVDMTTAAAAAAEGDADSAFLVVNPATVLSVKNKAAYNQQVKVQQVEAMRMLLETEAATAAASAAADLEAKKQPVAAARASAAAAAAAAAAAQAAAAATTEGTETEGSPAATSCHKQQQQQQQQLDTMNCSSPGYWPSKTSAAAAASLALKQQQQAAAAALVAAMRQEVQAGRETMLRQVESDTAAMQAKHKLETQVLQQQLLQQEQQQQAAAATRATLLKAVRRASAVAWQQQQQMSGDFMRRCNMFSKHVKRGEVAVVRAAQQQQADAQVAQQRLLYEEAAELAHQKQQEMMEELKLRNLQDKQQLESLLSATKSVLATEQAALRAKVAAAVLQEKAMLMSVGPSGGVWGSATAAEVLREPLKMSLIGTVVMDTTSSSEGTDVAQSTVDLQLT